MRAPDEQQQRRPAVTRKRLLSAKSTRPRSHECPYCSAVFCSTSAFETTWSPGAMPDDLLHIGRHHLAAVTSTRRKLSLAIGWHVHPVAIVQVQDRDRRHHRPHLLLLAVESGGYEHAEAHHAGILHLAAAPWRCGCWDRESARYCRSRREDAVRDRRSDWMSAYSPRCTNGEIVFVDVADDPHVRKIGDGERVGRIVERLDVPPPR